MKVLLHEVRLPLEHEFTIARGSRNHQDSLIVEIQHDGISGYGEATENPYYEMTLSSMAESVERCRPIVESFEFGTPDGLWDQVHNELPKEPFPLAAIDMAAHDLFGKLQGRPTYETLGLKWDATTESSYTIGIDSLPQMLAKLQERPNWNIYKIKLGTERDVEIIKELRKHTDAIFRVDANCGWTAEETIANSVELKSLGVEFIEQPLPADASTSDHRRVYENSELPIVADESCLVESDVATCEGRFHGVNVKLSKCGGLTPGVRMLRHARSLGMKTMVGCMIESSVGISAAAQLLPLLDYADLDGAELLAHDAAEGVTIADGVVRLAETFGNGIEMRIGVCSEF